MYRLKRIVVFVAVLVLLLSVTLPLSAFADVVEFTEAAKAGAVIVDLYGMANNTSLAYDYISDGSALTVIENLYSEYSSSASDPYTLAAIGAAAAAAGTIAVVYDAVTGQGYVQLYQEQYISSLDGFWDYTLDDLGFLKDQDGNYIWESNNNVIAPVSVISFIDGFAGQPIPHTANTSLTDAQKFNASKQVLTYTNTITGMLQWSNNPSYGCYVFCVPWSSGSNSGYEVFIVSKSSYNYRYCFKYTNNNSYYIREGSMSYTDSTTGLRYGSQLSQSDVNLHYVPQVTVFSSLRAGLDALASGLQNPSDVSLTNTNYIGDPLANPAVITIPDPSNPLYNPNPITIPTNIPWNPLWGDPLPDGVSSPTPGVPYPVTDPATLNNAIPDIWDSIVAGDVQVSEPNPEPDPDPDPDPSPSPSGPEEVFIPLLPVTAPSFNFNFAGIWHYVRDWVNSLGAFLSFLLVSWSALPYAIVVPVYASLVILIVLGVYRRFFM